MYFVIGKPGHAPRVIIQETDPEVAALQLLPGEVGAPVDVVQSYIIADDGLSVIPAVQSDADRWLEIRARRAALLAACDWTQLPDVPASTSAGWSTYRQELRDIPSTFSSPADVVWPAPPTNMEQQ